MRASLMLRASLHRTAHGFALAAALTGAACSGTPSAEPATGGTAPARRAMGSPDGGPPRGAHPTTASALAYRQIEGHLVAWDDAQGDGRLDDAAQHESHLRALVDAEQPRLERALRGEEGLAAQALAASALAFASDPRTTNQLVGALAVTDARVVGNALIALSVRRDPATPLGPVLGWIERGVPAPVRRYAPLAFAHVWDARRDAGRPLDVGTSSSARVRLLGLVDDPDPVVRLHVVKAMGALGGSESAEVLIERMGDAHDRVRFAAAAALVRVGDLRGFPALVKLLHETPGPSKHIVRDLLVEFAGKLEGASLDAATVEQLGVGARSWSAWFDAHRLARATPSAPARGS